MMSCSLFVDAVDLAKHLLTVGTWTKQTLPNIHRECHMRVQTSPQQHLSSTKERCIAVGQMASLSC